MVVELGARRRMHNDGASRLDTHGAAQANPQWVHPPALAFASHPARNFAIASSRVEVPCVDLVGVMAITNCLIWVSSVNQFTAVAICLLTDHVQVTDT